LPVIIFIPVGIGAFYFCWFFPHFWIIIQESELKKARKKVGGNFGFG
jgi:hypothetical protein